MNVVSSTFNAISAVMDGASSLIEGTSHEARQWTNRRAKTTQLRDEMYVNEVIAEYEKSKRRLEKLKLSEDTIKLRNEILAKFNQD